MSRGEAVASLELAEALGRLGIDVNFWTTRRVPTREERAKAVFALDDSEIGTLPVSPNPMATLISVIKEADELGREGKTERAISRYAELIDDALWPFMHIEIGALLIGRAGAQELPLTGVDLSRQYTELIARDDMNGSDPNNTVRVPLVHPQTGPTEKLINLSLEANGRAYGYYYRRLQTPGGGVHDEPEKFMRLEVSSAFLVLDGLRLGLLERLEPEAVDLVCHVYEGWIEEHYYDLIPAATLSLGNRPPRRIENELSQRFAETSGRIRPLIRGLSESRNRLLREFGWFDSIPVNAGKYFTHAEWQLSSLRDPDYDLKSVVSYYALSVEAILQFEIGRSIDVFLETCDRAEAERFRRAFSDTNQARRWTKELTIGQYRRLLTKAFFKNALSRVGADVPFYFHALPGLLKSLPDDYRNPAAHEKARIQFAPDASQYSFSRQEVAALRRNVVEILSKMISARPRSRRTA